MTDRKRPSGWPLLLLSLPAFVAVWSGWVGLGEMTGFGVVEPLPGIVDLRVNTAVTLPIGAEVLGVIAARAWLDPAVCTRARRFAYRLLWIAAAYGAAGQAAYHLMAAAGWTAAPWPVTLGVSVLPVGIIVLGLILYHMIHYTEDAGASRTEDSRTDTPPAPAVIAPARPATVAAPVAVQVPASAALAAPVPVSRPDGFPDIDPADRAAVVAWVSTLRSPPSDRTLGRWFGRSRTWGRHVLDEAAWSPRHEADDDRPADQAGEDETCAQLCDQAVAVQPDPPVSPGG